MPIQLIGNATRADHAQQLLLDILLMIPPTNVSQHAPLDIIKTHPQADVSSTAVSASLLLKEAANVYQSVHLGTTDHK